MDYENDTAWVRGMLYPGENLLWSGKPGKGHFFRKEDLPMLPFSLLWCGVAFYAQYTAAKSGASLMPRLWGLLITCLGLYFMFGRFVVRWINTRKSRYALTSQRIIVQVGKVSKSMDLQYLPRMTVTRFPDGNGDIRFGDTVSARRDSTGYERSSFADAMTELRNIPDVSNVEYRIRTAVEQAYRAKQSE